MKMKIVIMLTFMLFSVEVYAACTGSSPAWTSTPDYESVNSCVNYASPQDTINVLAGSATWATTLTITKGINLIGAGNGNTVITSTRTPVMDYLPSAQYRPYNYKFRVSGFTFNLGGSGQGIHLHNESTYPPQNKIRIDHNRFYNTTHTGGAIENEGCRGVIDNNTFDEIHYPLRVGWGDGSGLWDWQNYPEMVFGAANDNIYVEDNVFNDQGATVTDADQGGRYVVRYNTFTITNNLWPFLDMHGWHGGYYSTMGAEVYGNRLIGNYEVRLMSQRGGRAVVFYNNYTTTQDFNSYVYNNDGCAPDPPGQRINNSYYWRNRKNFTGTLVDVGIASDVCGDIVENSSFWHDAVPFAGAIGIGCGRLTDRPTTCTTGVGYWATDQSCTDLTGMVGANPAAPISGTLYKCTAPNTWTPYYTPYTYPHPLRLGDLLPNPPKNLQIIK